MTKQKYFEIEKKQNNDHSRNHLTVKLVYLSCIVSYTNFYYIGCRVC